MTRGDIDGKNINLSPKNRLCAALRQNKALLIMIAAVLVLIVVFAPQFFSAQNIINVARQTALTGIAALGMTFVMLTGGIDLSVGGVFAFSGVLFALNVQYGMPVGVGILYAISAGLLCGLLNSIGVLFFRIPSFIMTLAMSSVTSGLALSICNGFPVEFVNVKSPVIDFLGNGDLFNIPGPFIIFIILAVLFAVILRYMPLGRYIYSVGSNMEGARLAGVRTTRVVMITYLICSACAAFAGIVTACRLTVGHPTVGGTIALDSIAAIVIGGTQLSGGKGSISGTVVGIVLMTVAINLLNLLGISPYIQQIFKGIIIVCAILLSTRGLLGGIKKAWHSL